MEGPCTIIVGCTHSLFDSGRGVVILAHFKNSRWVDKFYVLLNVCRKDAWEQVVERQDESNSDVILCYCSHLFLLCDRDHQAHQGKQRCHQLHYAHNDVNESSFFIILSKLLSLQECQHLDCSLHLSIDHLLQ